MSNWDRNDQGDRPSGGSTTDPKEGRASTSGTPERAPQPSTRSEGRGSGPAPADRQAAPRRPIGAVLAGLIIGLLLGAGGATFLANQDGGDDFAGSVDKTRFQAVILSNDKVYFGRISTVSDEFYELDSAFFLRETRDGEDAEPVRALLPVNREIHAPDNSMLIRKDEVVLVENLAKDSPILAEIKRQKG